MKKIKLLCGFLIGLIILSSCSNDENSDLKPTIVGNWKITKRAYSCSSNIEQDIEIDDCRKKSTISFLDNGNLILSDFSYINNQCTLTTIKGKWVSNNNKLKITLVNTDDPTYIDFKNNTLKIGYYSTDTTKICNDNTKVYYSYIQFEKQ